MLKNYFKIAFRTIWRNKTFSFINIFGLSTGMACAFLLYLYIHHELSFDNFHAQSEDIFIIQSTYTSDKETRKFIYSMGGVAEALKKDYPEVSDAVRIRQWSGLLAYQSKKFNSEGLIYTDESFFNILPYSFLFGNPKDALRNPNSVVLTKDLAIKLFGNASGAFQKNITLDNQSLLVSGVIENIPDNTSLPFEAVMPIKAISQARLEDIGAAGWVGIGCQTLVRLKPKADFEALNKKIPAIQKYYKEASQKLGHQFSMCLVPLNFVRLYDYGEGSGNTIFYVYILGALAILILMIAAANYTNLATARSVTRAKEVGIRKVVGSYRWQLMGQFLTEAFVFTFLGLLLSLFVVELSLSFFNDLANKKLTTRAILQADSLLGLGLIYLILSLLSGLYPAFVLSSF